MYVPLLCGGLVTGLVAAQMVRDTFGDPPLTRIGTEDNIEMLRRFFIALLLFASSGVQILAAVTL